MQLGIFIDHNSLARAQRCIEESKDSIPALRDLQWGQILTQGVKEGQERIRRLPLPLSLFLTDFQPLCRDHFL